MVWFCNINLKKLLKLLNVSITEIKLKKIKVKICDVIHNKGNSMQ